MIVATFAHTYIYMRTQTAELIRIKIKLNLIGDQHTTRAPNRQNFSHIQFYQQIQPTNSGYLLNFMCETSKCTVNIKRIQLFLESEQIYRANLNIYKNNNTRYILCHLFENGKVFLLQSSNYSCIKFNSVSFFNLFIKVIFFLSPFCKYNFIVTITHMVFSYGVFI